MIKLLLRLLLYTCISVTHAQYMFGGFGRGCGCQQPMCQPRSPCSAPPMPMPMCPPPAPCPPQFCPPPPICPPPPPPPAPLPCPPPPPLPRPSCPCMSRPYMPMYQPPIYQPAVQYQQPFPTAGGCGGSPNPPFLPSARIPAQNDCCCGCSSPCKYRTRRRSAFAAKTVDPSCNNIELKNILLENISNDASESKRAIQRAAEAALEVEINVICGSGEFSYIAHTDTFCQTSKEDITCYAFKPL